MKSNIESTPNKCSSFFPSEEQAIWETAVLQGRAPSQNELAFANGDYLMSKPGGLPSTLNNGGIMSKEPLAVTENVAVSSVVVVILLQILCFSVI